MTQENWLQILTDCVDRSDPILTSYFKNKKLDIHYKSNQTPVTQADKEAEQAIRNVLLSHDPTLRLIGEEYPSTNTPSETTVIIDPIDGTQNFIRAIPFFATLIAVIQDNQLIASMVSAPLTNDRWWAVSGEGAYHNGEKVHVSTIDTLPQSQLFHGSLAGYEAQGLPEKTLALLNETYRQRGFGDYYMHMLVAMGCGEAALDVNLKAWDIAALIPILEEAGGQVTDLSGAELKNQLLENLSDPQLNEKTWHIVTSNSRLHNQILEKI